MLYLNCKIIACIQLLFRPSLLLGSIAPIEPPVKNLFLANFMPCRLLLPSTSPYFKQITQTGILLECLALIITLSVLILSDAVLIVILKLPRYIKWFTSFLGVCLYGPNMAP